MGAAAWKDSTAGPGIGNLLRSSLIGAGISVCESDVEAEGYGSAGRCDGIYNEASSSVGQIDK